MTKEGILAMDAGAELDILIQEQVFGKKVLRIGNRNFPEESKEERRAWNLRCVSCGDQDPVSSGGFDMDPSRHICFNFCLGREGQPLRRKGSFGELILPYYSTDILAAWEILRKLRGEYWCIEIKIADGCWVIMELLRTPPIKVEVNTRTSFEKLPEAICKAALLAKSEKEKEEEPSVRETA